MAIIPDGKNRIMIFGPKNDGTYVVEFRAAAGETLAISIPRTEAAVVRHFQERMPYGLTRVCVAFPARCSNIISEGAELLVRSYGSRHTHN